MKLEAIEAILRQKIGFDAQIIGSRKIARAVENRCSIYGLSDFEDYLNILQKSPDELQELVEQIVVPETYFFRDRKPFDFLVNHAQTNCFLSSNRAKLRLLSVPCSSGEEPYSMAIALLEAGLPTHRFSIDAMDISRFAIAKAQRGVYGKNSFRGENWVNLDRYFQTSADKYEVISSVRSAVNFWQGNLLNAFNNVQAQYDIIFCRNLLIYLETNACSQVLAILERLLVPNGLLFVGASETAKVPGDRFRSIRQSFTFAYQKIESIQLPSSLKQDATELLDISSPLTYKPLQNEPLTQPSFSRSSFRSSILEQKLKTSQLATPETVNPSPQSNLILARQLADIGQIEAAIKNCQDYIERHFTNEEAYTLLGTLYQTKAEYTQAEKFFKKALYLNPNCYEALMHLALLKEHRGDTTGATLLQQRIQKLQQTSQFS